MTFSSSRWIYNSILAISAAFLSILIPLEASRICPQNGTIVCPCGTTGKFYSTKCDQSLKDPCEKFRFCESCSEDANFCTSCPLGKRGRFCVEEDSTLYPNTTDREELHNINRRSPACPELKGPKAGSIRCWFSSNERECTGRCLPGYRFQNRNEEEIVLRCSGNHWTPDPSYPPCVSGGECDLLMAGAGRFNCTSEVRGTFCDVSCTGTPRIFNRYFCYPGREWEPPLPYCVRRKGESSAQPPAPPPEPYDCGCQNGGVCDSYTRTCNCQEGFQGQYCEHRIEVYKVRCSDPGYIQNGERTNSPNGYQKNSYEEGDSVLYTCKRGFGLMGQSLLTCQSSGQWNPSKPICERINQFPTPHVTAKPLIICPDPGLIENGDRWTIEGKPSTRGDTLESGMSVVFSCRDGYALQGPTMMTCLPTRQWSNNLPTCNRMAPSTEDDDYDEQIVYCSDPGTDENAIRKETPWIDAKRQDSNSQNSPEYPQGFKFRYECKNGYNLVGDSTLLCLFTGVWSGDTPRCEKDKNTMRPSGSYCKDPGEFPYGDKIVILPINERRRPSGSSVLSRSRGSSRRSRSRVLGRSSRSRDEDDLEYPQGHRMQFTCFEGYKRRGKEFLTCLKSGRWDGSLPSCVPV